MDAMRRPWPCLRPTPLGSLLCLLLLLGVLPASEGQLSHILPHVKRQDASKNKFLQRKATDDAKPPPPTMDDEENPYEGLCPQNLELRWMTEVTSSVYATPLITDLYSDGAKDVVVPSFVHHLEVLEAADGAQAAGWPAFHKSKVHASPLLYDIDSDGVQDILIATYDGQILAFRDTGESMMERLTVERLKVRRDWYKGLAADPIDHSHPDVGDGDEPPTAAQRVGLQDVHKSVGRRRLMAEPVPDANSQQQQAQQGGAAQASPIFAEEAGQIEPKRTRGRSVIPRAPGTSPSGTQQADSAPGLKDAGSSPTPDAPVQQREASGAGVIDTADESVTEAAADEVSEEGADTFAELFDEDTEGNIAELVDPVTASQVVGAPELDGDAALEAAREAEMEELDPDERFGRAYASDYEDVAKAVERETAAEAAHDRLEAAHAAQAHAAPGTPPVLSEAADVTLESLSRQAGWDDETFVEGSRLRSEGQVYIDAHILCTPSIADIDGDGHDELVAAVSYFFDREYYDNPARTRELDPGIDMSKYVGGAVVVFDLRLRRVKWQQHLDLSTDSTPYRAYIYSAPVLVDLDRDGKLEVVVGTSAGFLYVLDCKGAPREGWPIQMAEIQAQPAVADINGDGEVEIVVADVHGNVAAFNWRGREIWERHLKSLISQGASIGDIDGDGQLEVVVGTSAGRVHALLGSDGTDKANFPFQTRGRIMAPVLLTQLAAPSEPTALHAVVMSFDGYLYMIDGASGCADTVDVGETSYTMVLADDLNADGKLDLLVSTMNGNVYVFSSPAAYHPLKAWTSQVHGRNNRLSRWGMQGVFATDDARAPRDVRGHTLPVRFEIVDRRPLPPAQGAVHGDTAQAQRRGPYTVAVSLQGVGLDAMNSGPQPVVGMTDIYHEPGVYVLEIPCPRTRSTATVHIEMSDEHKLAFVDEFSLSFHMHYYRLLKWLVAVPFTAAALAVLALQVGGFNDQLPTLGSLRQD